MRRVTTDGRLLAAGVSALAFLVLATAALINRPDAPTPLAAAGEDSSPAATAAARAILDALDDVIPSHVEFHGAAPTIDNLGDKPRILIARLEGVGTAERLRTDGELHSPLDLAIERVLVDEVETPPGARYVTVGGTTAGGQTQTASGLGPPLEIGKRYLLFASPLILEDGTFDLRHLLVSYSLPIGADGADAARSSRGVEQRTALSTLIAQIESTAARQDWKPFPGRPVRR